ncbi:HTH domain-containing protein, Cro/C1-type [Desulfonema limicola]|uniref:HTH domain-containing protein, Cro/C1-type n=1 Tax=Desulfonema limicola TaxID=45656 RepID=A0A975BEX2_9BACT|nr:helix-turn-helix transcriptional regulator [Desulfonema limicola]QTA83889.1 HTH domain-containing protein, Cro/C1-type [Desulfonema limicola]
MSQIEERIKAVRSFARLTQTEFAERLGITRSHVAKIETGKAKSSQQLIKLICEKFTINEEWLKTGEGMFADENFRVTNFFKIDPLTDKVDNAIKIITKNFAVDDTVKNSTKIDFFKGTIEGTVFSISLTCKSFFEITEEFLKSINEKEKINKEDADSLFQSINDLENKLLNCLLTIFFIKDAFIKDKKTIKKYGIEIIAKLIFLHEQITIEENSSKNKEI